MKLEVKNLTKSFGEKEVLHGISFDVEGGKALVFLDVMVQERLQL